MKEIKNKTSRPLRVPLPGGKTLHLGPARVAQIADNAIEHAEFKKLVADGSVEVLGDTDKRTGNRGSGPSAQRSQANIKSFRRGQGDR